MPMLGNKLGSFLMVVQVAAITFAITGVFAWTSWPWIFAPTALMIVFAALRSAVVNTVVLVMYVREQQLSGLSVSTKLKPLASKIDASKRIILAMEDEALQDDEQDLAIAKAVAEIKAKTALKKAQQAEARAKAKKRKD